MGLITQAGGVGHAPLGLLKCHPRALKAAAGLPMEARAEWVRETNRLLITSFYF